MRLTIIATGDWTESPETVLSLPLATDLPLIQIERLTAAGLVTRPGAEITLQLEDGEDTPLRIERADRLDGTVVARFVRRVVEAMRA